MIITGAIRPMWAGLSIHQNRRPYSASWRRSASPAKRICLKTPRGIDAVRPKPNIGRVRFTKARTGEYRTGPKGFNKTENPLNVDSVLNERVH